MQQFKGIRNIHFIGIGGSGMIGIATILHKKGFTISGSDILKTKELDKLAMSGVAINYSHKRENVNHKDLIVLSSAIDSANVEVVSAKKKNIPIVPRAEMLSGILRGYQGIAIAGSHGKTTTTSLIAHIFNQALLSPTYVIGGKILSSEGNSRLGDGKFFIFEADESDKSFLSFYPDSSVITNNKLIVIVCDNGGHAVINRLQLFKGGKEFNCLFESSNVSNLVKVNFAKHAESMGAKSEEVSSISELEEAFKRAKKSKVTYVISIKTHSYQWLEGSAYWESPTLEIPKTKENEKALKLHKEGKAKQRQGV